MNSNVEREALRATKAGRERSSHLGRRLRMEGTRWACAHCEASSDIRTSRLLSPTLRETVYACTNPECGHTFLVLAEVVRTLSPSAAPDPAVCLPLSSHVRRDLVRAQLDYAPQAQHAPMFLPAPAQGDLLLQQPLLGAADPP